MEDQPKSTAKIKEVKLTEIDEVSNEVAQSVAEQVTLGELDMRRNAAENIIGLFKVTNLFVL